MKKLDVSMISGPGNDLRHTGHIGYDGAVFGDVSFIGDNYSRLPMKIVSGTLFSNNFMLHLFVYRHQLYMS